MNRRDLPIFELEAALVDALRREDYGGFHYTSARMKTQGKKSWTYGRMEARIKLPVKQGTWPGWWMLGSNIDSTTGLLGDLGGAVLDPIGQAFRRVLVVETDIERRPCLAGNDIGGVIANIDAGEGQG